MKRDRIMRALALLVIVLLVGSVGLTIYVNGQMKHYRDTMNRRKHDLQGLANVRRDLDAHEAAHSLFDNCGIAPPPLMELIETVLPAGQAPEVRAFSEPGPSGWTRRRHELSFEQVPIVEAINFARAAEMPVEDSDGHQRPSWRLIRCTIRSAPGRPGSGRVVLVLEALVKE